MIEPFASAQSGTAGSMKVAGGLVEKVMG